MSRHNPDRWTHDPEAHARAGGLDVSAAKEGCVLCDELEYADYEFACPHCHVELFAPWVPCPNCEPEPAPRRKVEVVELPEEEE